MQNYAKLHGGMGIYDDLMMIYGATLSLSSSPLLDEFIYGATATDSFLGGMFLNAFKELLVRF